ncbi:MAG: hypothetical protein QXM79_07255 [Zestosphaera sp.]
MKVVKIDDEAYQLLEQLANKTGSSIKDVVSKAVKLLYTGESNVSIDKEVSEITEKVITLKYATKCKRCSRELKEGEHAYYVKYLYNDNTAKSLVYCIDCYHETLISDKALAKLYVKKKELERVIKALRKETDTLVDDAEITSKINEVMNVINKIYNTGIDVLSILTTNENKAEKIDELVATSEELKKLLAELKQVVAQAIRQVKKKHRQEPELRWYR